MVKFCPRCGAMMIMRKRGGKIYYICPRCGYKEEARRDDALKHSVRVKIKHTEKEKTIIVDAGSEIANLPITREVTCPRCGYHEAYYYFMQTRSADEPMTRFFICRRCGYRWREYD